MEPVYTMEKIQQYWINCKMSLVKTSTCMGGKDLEVFQGSCEKKLSELELKEFALQCEEDRTQDFVFNERMCARRSRTWKRWGGSIKNRWTKTKNGVREIKEKDG